MKPTRLGILAACVVGIVLASCQRDPLEAKVSASTQSAYDTWRSSIASDGAPDLRRRVEEATQEIRMKVGADLMRGKTGQGRVAPSAIDEGLLKEIDGRPLRDVLQLGYELRVRRLKTELAELEESMKQNAQLVTKPGDLESKHYLEALQGRQATRVEKYREDIAAAERELAPLRKASGKTLLPAGSDKPGETPQPK